VAAKEPLAVEVTADADVDRSARGSLGGPTCCAARRCISTPSATKTQAGRKRRVAADLVWSRASPGGENRRLGHLRTGIGTKRVSAKLARRRPGPPRSRGRKGHGGPCGRSQIGSASRGRNVHVGSDVIVHRGTGDVSGLCAVDSSLPRVVQYVMTRRPCGQRARCVAHHLHASRQATTLAVRVLRRSCRSRGESSSSRGRPFWPRARWFRCASIWSGRTAAASIRP